MNKTLTDYTTVFFIGIAGAGMSAIAQYLAGSGINVSGSDRYFKENEFNETRSKLEAEGIKCFLQDGEGINSKTDLVVVSSAIEDTVAEMQKAKQLGIPVLLRSDVLALIANSKRTIAVGGTSGKSTTSAMLFGILEYAGYDPGIISGAGLTSLIKLGKIGNAKVGTGQWLVIEADESDGSIVKYEPEIGLLLNIDKDHQEIDELIQLFSIFRDNSKYFIVNRGNALAKQLATGTGKDFTTDENRDAFFVARDFRQEGFSIHFTVEETAFEINAIGRHTMENALAAIAVANIIGIELETCAKALQGYEGIFRRHQVLGQKKGIWVIDDYAHNPVKCASSIAACQPLAKKVVAWFQPHGYGPTKFLRNDFVREIAAVLRPEDEIWMSEIFYAGGTTLKDISANDLINDIKTLGKHAFFVEDRKDFLSSVRTHLSTGSVLLLMGARDPSLEKFGTDIFEKL